MFEFGIDSGQSEWALSRMHEGVRLTVSAYKHTVTPLARNLDFHSFLEELS